MEEIGAVTDGDGACTIWGRRKEKKKNKIVGEMRSEGCLREKLRCRSHENLQRSPK
jgi:hypothetical protein